MYVCKHVYIPYLQIYPCTFATFKIKFRSSTRHNKIKTNKTETQDMMMSYAEANEELTRVKVGYVKWQYSNC